VVSLRRITLVLFIIAEPLGWLGCSAQPCGATTFSRDHEQCDTRADTLSSALRWARYRWIEPCRAPQELGMGRPPMNAGQRVHELFNCTGIRAPVAARSRNRLSPRHSFSRPRWTKRAERLTKQQLRIKKMGRWPRGGSRLQIADGGRSYRLLHCLESVRITQAGSALWPDRALGHL